jgi:hypothetical protein
MIRQLSAFAIRRTLLVAPLSGFAVVAPALVPAPVAAQEFGACPYDDPHATIQRGDTGEAVAHAQCILNLGGEYDLAEDGDFGPETEAAVKDFQEFWGLEVDGVVGECTWAALHVPHDRPEQDCFVDGQESDQESEQEESTPTA